MILAEAIDLWRAALPYALHPADIPRNIAWHNPSTISPSKHIFIVGCPRSGTTLLQRILSLHPLLLSTEGESNLLSAREIFSREWFDLPRGDLHSLFSMSLDLVDFFDNSVEYLTGGNSSIIFLEKTPQYILKMPSLLRYFPNSRYIHILRDGRDCYLSSLANAFIPQRTSVAKFARYWNGCINVWRKSARADLCYQIQYEKLVEHPEPVIKAVCSWLGIEFSSDMINSRFIKNDRHSSMPAFAKLNEPINAGSCSRWKTEMKPHDLQDFLRIAKDNLALSGYEI